MCSETPFRLSTRISFRGPTLDCHTLLETGTYPILNRGHARIVLPLGSRPDLFTPSRGRGSESGWRAARVSKRYLILPCACMQRAARAGINLRDSQYQPNAIDINY